MKASEIFLIFQKFVFSTSFSQKQKNATSLFLGIEILFTAFFITILIVIYPLDEQFFVLPMLIVLSLIGLENCFYLIKFRSQPEVFKIGVSNKLVAYFDREMHLYYYDGLQRVEIYQDMLNFKYKKDLNLFLNLEVIPKDKMVEFLNSLKGVLDHDKVFFDDSFHQYLTNLSD